MSADTRIEGTQSIECRYDGDRRILSVFDRDAAAGAFCVADPADLPHWERGSPFRQILAWSFRDHGKASLAHDDGFNPMAMTARAAIFAELGGFDPSYRRAEDFNWIVRALAHDHSVAVVPALVTKRRLHGRNLIADVGESQREMFRSLAEHIRTQRNG